MFRQAIIPMEELCGIDVSFIFLDLVREVEWNIRDQQWQSALALALTLPDICGSIAYPEIVKNIGTDASC